MRLRGGLAKAFGAVLITVAVMPRVDEYGWVEPPGEDEVPKSYGCCPVDKERFPIALWDPADPPTCPIHEKYLKSC